jgi:hypothetical protein
MSSVINKCEESNKMFTYETFLKQKYKNGRSRKSGQRVGIKNNNHGKRCFNQNH